MKPGENAFTQELRDSFAAFWQENLQIEDCPDGLTLALPLMDAQGWQIQLRLKKVSPTQWLATDLGRTLGMLEDAGKNPAKGKIADVIEAQATFYGFTREGMELVTPIRFPFDPATIQIFAEGLVALSHLCPKLGVDVTKNSFYRVEERIGSYFQRHNWSPKRNHALSGKVEEKIVVDYFLENPSRPMALQPISRSRNLKGFMEQWGFRWQDLRDAHPEILRAMVFDPDSQDWDSSSIRIGESVCDVFVPYTEAEDALDGVLVA